MSKIFSTLGILVGALALASLAQGVFTEPLGQFLDGVMGGVLELYHAFRSILFSTFFLPFVWLVNLMKGVDYFSWLPSAPWFDMPWWLGDYLVIGGLIGTAYVQALKLATDGYWSVTRVFRAVLIWPIFIFQLFFTGAKAGQYMDLDGESDDFHYFDESMGASHYLTLFMLGRLVFATMIFFLVAYAETRIGF